MGRPKGVPALRRHAPSSLGVVRLNGHDTYLGRWPAGMSDPPPEVQAAYDREIAEWLARGRQPRPPAAAPSPPAAAEAGEDSPAAPSPPVALTVTELVVRFWVWVQGHYRRADGTPTNEQTELKCSLRPLVHLYGSLPAHEFGPLKLKAVRELMVKGRCAAREKAPVKVVSQETVEATLPHLTFRHGSETGSFG